MPTRIVATNMRRLALVLWAVAVALVVIGLVANGLRAAWLVPVPSLFTAWFAWVVLWRPRIELTEDELVVVDVRRTTRFAWRRVQDVRSKYGLEIVTDQGEQRVWIAPRPTARLAIDQPGGPVPVSVAAAADEIRARVPAPVEHVGAPPATVTAAPIVHRVHGWAIVALVVLGIAGSMAGARL
ncbi:PH domain-containing protein [Curtobacterium sp. VKM Ac-2865]|uniref:PH domain-containing protein n=1 Tax=Curtobacterium sp. VKM Ac-2865 TaxID=2783817 RepID=UPI00188B2323|nr:PH domain-containing protein [Curtobacterium sp. VKM Ac-2865]MBF4584000.1 PH domain-containing protein [Curtobacterium sp. VKM Ac-2865]